MSTFTAGLTPCGDQVIGEGCWDSGTATGNWVSLLAPDGTVRIVDVRTGAAVLAANVLADCVMTRTETTQVVIATTAIQVVPNASDLTAWEVRHRSGTVTVQVNAGPIHTLDPSEVLGSSAQDGSTLTDIVSVNATTGSARIIFTQRNP